MKDIQIVMSGLAIRNMKKAIEIGPVTARQHFDAARLHALALNVDPLDESRRAKVLDHLEKATVFGWPTDGLIDAPEFHDVNDEARFKDILAQGRHGTPSSPEGELYITPTREPRLRVLEPHAPSVR